MRKKFRLLCYLPRGLSNFRAKENVVSGLRGISTLTILQDFKTILCGLMDTINTKARHHM